MDSFEGLGLGPEIMEGLVAEGIETPTELQRHAVPVLRRGNSAVLRAGPGAGVLVAYGSALLDRLEPQSRRPRALILTPSRERAYALATSLSHLALMTRHRVAALGVPWALASHADLLFTTPRDLLGAIQSAEVKVEGVEAVVLDGAAALLEDPERELVDGALDAVPDGEMQWIVVSEPLTPQVRGFVEKRMKRAVFLPPDASLETEEKSPVQRGSLQVRTVPGDRDEGALSLVAELLDDEYEHVLLFFRSEVRAADAGDFLSVHGYLADAPGSPDSPVWLATEALEAREAVGKISDEGVRVAAVSVDVPPDADTLDRRHGGAFGGGMILALPRELPHLRRAAAVAGYSLSLQPEPPPPGRDEISRFRSRIETALSEEDLAAYLLVLEPLLDRWGSAEVAAALALILRREEGAARSAAAAKGKGRAGPPSVGRPPPPAWAKLFLSVGKRDGIGPGDVVGAITGEAGLEGHQVGRIDIRDSFSRVEVEEPMAVRVIEALNGISIRGRSVRADYDRSEGKGGRDASGQKGRGPSRRSARGGESRRS